MTDPESVDPDLEMPSYVPFGSDAWTFEECLNGDLLLELSYMRSDGLYWDTEIGQGPDSWGI